MIFDHKVLAGIAFVIAIGLQPCNSVAGAKANDPVQELFGVSLYMTTDDVKDRLNGLCRTLSLHENRLPTLPIAQVREQQIICNGFDNDEWNLSEIAFVFGDDTLHMIEAHGDNTRAAFDHLPGETFPYAGHQANREALAFADEGRDRLVFLTEEGAHAHLILWRSKFLPSNQEKSSENQTSASPPSILRFGESLEELRAKFEAECNFLAERPVNNPVLSRFSEQQVQLDCFGLGYAGFPRKLEAVFADGRLELAWILTGKPEENRLRDALISEFGTPTRTNRHWDEFQDGRIGLRKDKPEVLFLSDRTKDLFPDFFAH
jgi:hypothetical protein